MKTFKTPKGTLLPLMDLKGKDYLQVCHRVQWFREEWPNGQINTERMSESPSQVTYRATIYVEHTDLGLTKLANADKTVLIKSTLDYEKCETAAIGRALALCGYGTQFAQDLEEDDTLPESPVEKKPAMFVRQASEVPVQTSGPESSPFPDIPPFETWDEHAYVNQDSEPSASKIMDAITNHNAYKPPVGDRINGDMKFMKGKYMGQTFDRRLKEDKADNYSYLAFIKNMPNKTALIRQYIQFCEQQGVK